MMKSETIESIESIFQRLVTVQERSIVQRFVT